MPLLTGKNLQHWKAFSVHAGCLSGPSQPRPSTFVVANSGSFLVATRVTPHDEGTLNKEPPMQEFRPWPRMSAVAWDSVFTEEAHSRLVRLECTIQTRNRACKSHCGFLSGCRCACVQHYKTTCWVEAIKHPCCRIVASSVELSAHRCSANPCP